MDAEAARAFTPLTLGPLSLRNRFIKSATNEGMAKGGVPSKLLVEHHRRIAAGGVGMTTVAYCAVTADGRTFEDQVLTDAPSVRHLRALTEAVHRQGAAASAQLTHGGCFTFLPKLSTQYPLSASGGFNAAGVLSGRLFKTAMTRQDMERVAQQFVAAARLAREAGFDAVELHMGHGYLLSQFLSPRYNRRRDAYGGDAAQRATYPAEVLARVLDAVGQTLAVGCKLSVIEGYKGGAGAEEAAAIARVLERTGAHFLVLSGGMNVEAPWAIFGSNMPAAAVETIQNPVVKIATRLMRLAEPKLRFHELYLREPSLRVRAAVKLPLVYLGGAKSLQGIARVMADGFDGIALGRALIHDPEFVNKLKNGTVSVSACTACNECVVTMYGASGTHCVLQGALADAARLNRQPAAD